MLGFEDSGMDNLKLEGSIISDEEVQKLARDILDLKSGLRQVVDVALKLGSKDASRLVSEMQTLTAEKDDSIAEMNNAIRAVLAKYDKGSSR
ncbi:MAG: hypothetical protein GX322_08660 [Firmicutes bacterium]|nr:hypothetical protein [Bacillota bacterium]